MNGHGSVDLTGQLDEACMTIKFPCLPGQVERVDRNAVPAQAGPGIERHETKRLSLCCFNNLPDVDSHRSIDELQLVYQGNVHAAEDILQELGRFGNAT